MKAQEMLRKAGRRESAPGAKGAAYRPDDFEVKSYGAEQVNAFWHGDFHDASRCVLTKQGGVQTRLLGVLDDHSRLACHAPLRHREPGRRRQWSWRGARPP
ncbi:MAG: hypothetical protein M0T84_00640 [Betaproteobacteria bacterium]|nr:hypothetical protein [Betaproteobacteria bacterium]